MIPLTGEPARSQTTSGLGSPLAYTKTLQINKFIETFKTIDNKPDI